MSALVQCWEGEENQPIGKTQNQRVRKTCATGKRAGAGANHHSAGPGITSGWYYSIKVALTEILDMHRAGEEVFQIFLDPMG
jgi:hypothetical protein